MRTKVTMTVEMVVVIVMVMVEMVMMFMETAMGHLLVSLFLLIVQFYIFFQGFLRVNLRLKFST